MGSMSPDLDRLDVGPAAAHFPIGCELATSSGLRFIVIGVHTKGDEGWLGLKRSTWWRRLYYRVRRLFS